MLQKLRVVAHLLQLLWGQLLPQQHLQLQLRPGVPLLLQVTMQGVTAHPIPTPTITTRSR